MDIIYTTWVLWLVLAVVVYRNAKSRNLKAASSWAIIAFLFGPFGLLGYYLMILKPNKKDV
jgi:hypothetical protein